MQVCELPFILRGILFIAVITGVFSGGCVCGEFGGVFFFFLLLTTHFLQYGATPDDGRVLSCGKIRSLCGISFSRGVPAGF